MAKIDLDTLASGYQSTSNLNDNFQSIEDELNDKVLYRDNPSGEANQMESNLDMNSKRILNLSAPVNDNEPARWADVKDGVTTTGTVLPSATSNEDKFLSSNGTGVVYRKGYIRYSTIADMTSDTTSVLGQVVSCDDYTADQDTGLMVFTVVAASTGTADGGSYLDHDTLSLQFERVFNNIVSVKEFGAAGDGSTDDTADIQSALSWAAANRNHSIYFPPGVYVTSSVITVSQGIKLVGNESQGSTEQYGTTLLVNHNGNGIHYSGTGTDFSGTGGGLKHFKVIKGAAYTGGQAILVDGTDINKRHGEMEFHDVLITANGAGSWQRGFHANGTSYVLAGGKGIRSINMNKIRVTDCSENEEYILLDQVTHYTGTHVQIDEGTGPGTPGMTVQGDSNNVLFANANINGEMKIGSSTATINGYVFMGRAASFNNTNSNVDGVVCAQIAGTITNSSTALNIYSSDETYIQELVCNKVSGADDELIKLQNNGTDQAALGTVSTTVASLKPLVSNGESWIYSRDGTTNERFVQFQYSRVRPNADNVMDNGNASFRWANTYSTNVRCTTLLPGGTSAQWTAGSGTPEGAVTADVGSLYTRTDGGSSTTLYVKESGVGNTGWVAK